MTFVRRRVGRKYRGNCWFLVLKLWFSGRLLGLLAERHAWRLPYTLGITRRENVVHFKADEPNRLFPFWIRAQVEVVRGSVWNRR